MKLKDIIAKEFQKGGELDLFTLAKLLEDKSLTEEQRERKYQYFKDMGNYLQISASIVDQSAEIMDMKLMDIENLIAIVAGYEVTADMLGKALESVAHISAKGVSDEKALEVMNSRKNILKEYLSGFMSSISIVDASTIMKMKNNREDKSE